MSKITNTTTGVSAEFEGQKQMQEVCDKGGLGVPFGCQTGICSTCLIKIKSGSENLNEMTEQEEFTLEARGAAENERLACQCVCKGDVEFEQ
jgi:ferredoxin